VFVPRSREYDVVDMAAVKRLYADAGPMLVVHLAARTGGIGANRDRPDQFFYDDPGVQLLEVTRQVGFANAAAGEPKPIPSAISKALGRSRTPTSPR
jgi:GDP-L-fucose synthase